MPKTVLIILLNFPLLIYSQSEYKGRIIDAKTKQGLQYVNIYIQGTTLGTVSNIYGEFQINVPKSYQNDTLICSIMGYQSKKIPINTLGINTEIQLKPYRQAIESITVQEKRIEPRTILRTSLDKCRENMYARKYRTKVFVRNLIQKDSLAIAYRKTLMRSIADRDYVWNGKGEIIADKYLSLPQKIARQIQNKHLNLSIINTHSFEFPRLLEADEIDNICHQIVKVDTVIFSKNSKIYVLDGIERNISPSVLPKIYRFLKNNRSPYTVAFDKTAQDNIVRIFEENQQKELYFVRYYIDAKQNNNIVKSLTFQILSDFNALTLQKTYHFVYTICSYANTPKSSILKHCVSFRKTLYTKSEMYHYFAYSSLYEQFNFEPEFDIKDSLNTPKNWQETIDYAYTTAVNQGVTNSSFDQWNRVKDFIKTDSLEQKAVNQILHPKKYYDVDMFYEHLRQAKNIKIKKQKRGNPEVNIPVRIYGTIVDSVSQEPLPYCNIVLKNLNDSTQKTIGAITDENGAFNLEMNLGYQYSMSISQIAYQSISDTLDLYVSPSQLKYYRNEQDIVSEDVGTVQLVPISQLLDEVTVKEQAQYLDIDKQSLVVTPQMRENAIASKDLLPNVEGVTFNKISEQIKVDGDKQVKLLVDGVEKSPEFILNLNPKRIKKIEVLRNISGLYATEGYTSVLNIITFNNYRGYGFMTDNQFIKSLSSKKRSNFLQNDADFSLNLIREKWSLWLKANSNYNKLNLLTRSTMLFKNTKIVNGNHLEPNHATESNRLGITFGADYKLATKHLIGAEMTLKGFPAFETTNNTSFDTISNNGLEHFTNSRLKTHSSFKDWQGNVSYRYNINRTTDLVSYLHFSERQSKLNQTIQTLPELHFKQSSYNLNYKLEFNKVFRNRYTITSGGRYLSNHFKSIGSDASKFTTNSNKLSIYSFLKIKFNKQSGLLMGASYENYQSENSQFSTSFNSVQPQIDLYKTIRKKHKLVLTYALKTQYPFLSDMNPQKTYITPFVAYQGNTKLSPYRYHHFDFQYSWMGDGFVNYVSLKPYYHYSNNEKGLITTLQNNLPVYQNQNFVKHEQYGCYAGLSFDITSRLQVSLEFDIYKDWNKNLSTDKVVDWYGDAQLTYAINRQHHLGLMYQKEYAKRITSLGYTKSGANYTMLYWKTQQLKGRLQLMLGYSLPLISPRTNEEYEQTPYHIRHHYTDVSFVNNMIMINLSFRLSKGKVLRNAVNIDNESYEYPKKRRSLYQR